MSDPTATGQPVSTRKYRVWKEVQDICILDLTQNLNARVPYESLGPFFPLLSPEALNSARFLLENSQEIVIEVNESEQKARVLRKPAQKTPPWNMFEGIRASEEFEVPAYDEVRRQAHEIVHSGKHPAADFPLSMEDLLPGRLLKQ